MSDEETQFKHGLSKSGAREFWATQLIGSEDGNYIMSDDAEFIERMAKVEIKFKVIEYSAFEDMKAERDTLKRDFVFNRDNASVLFDKNKQLESKLAEAQKGLRHIVSICVSGSGTEEEALNWIHTHADETLARLKGEK